MRKIEIEYSDDRSRGIPQKALRPLLRLHEGERCKCGTPATVAHRAGRSVALLCDSCAQHRRVDAELRELKAWRREHP